MFDLRRRRNHHPQIHPDSHALNGRGRMGRSGAAGPVLSLGDEAQMAALVGRPWGRYVTVQTHVRHQGGRQVVIPTHFRSWPGTKASLYFFY